MITKQALIETLALVAGLAFAPIAVKAQTTVTGTVVAEDGTPIVRAHLMAHRLGSAFTSRATSDAKGAFTMSSLVMGEYEVCIRTDYPYLLDPCIWRMPPQDFTLIKGQISLNNVRLVMRRGYPVVVRFDDPLSLIAKPGDKISAKPQSLFVGVRTLKGFFQDAPIVSSDAGGHNRVVYVLPKQPVVLHVVGHSLTLGDSTGKAIAFNSAKIPLVHPGTGAVNVNFQVK